MNNIEIRRPTEDDIIEPNNLFEVVIKDNFLKENVEDDDFINDEISDKNKKIRDDLNSNGEKIFFLIACFDNKIVGTIEYGPSSELVEELSDGRLKDVVEIGTVFVLPEYQKKGIGTLLINSLYITFLSRNINEFCLDSGYSIAKQIWTRKYGEPTIIKKDHWAENVDHFVWHINLDDIVISF